MVPSSDGGARSLTRGERVRAAARTLREPRTASWVADETDVSVKTAQKYLDQLVEDGVLQRVEHGGRTLYRVDRLMARYREVASLQREHDREELTDALDSMRERIAGWRDEYDVETPGELRGSVADLDDPSEVEERREAASEWEHLASRVPLVRAALNEYDWAAEDTVSAQMGLAGTTDPSVYEGLCDVLRRQPEVTSVAYRPDGISKRFVRATLAPARLDPPTGPDPPTLDVEWRFGSEDQQYRIHYADPNTGFSCGWHRDDDHPELGAVHFQYEDPATGETTHEAATFESGVPTEILWRALERLFDERLPSLTGNA